MVEDDADIADVLRRSLRNEGYEVRTSADGIEALDVAAAFIPDLVVLDLGLPRLDGMAVCRDLRKQRVNIPILMLTARDTVEDRVEAWTAAPTTTWSSPSRSVSCAPASGPCCGGAPRAEPPR